MAARRRLHLCSALLFSSIPFLPLLLNRFLHLPPPLHQLSTAHALSPKISPNLHLYLCQTILFSLLSPPLCFTFNTCLKKKDSWVRFLSFPFNFSPPANQSAPSSSPPILPRAVLNIPVHTHESESWPSVSTCNRNTRNALSPRALRSSGTCDVATISAPTRRPDAATHCCHIKGN